MKTKKKLCRQTFTTRKDFLYLFFLIALITVSLGLSIIFIQQNYYLKGIISILIFIIVGSLLLKNDITLEKYYIKINYGIFYIKVKYKNIKKIEKVENFLPGLSTSTIKVCIKDKKHKSFLFNTYVAPMDRDDFIYEVKRRI